MQITFKRVVSAVMIVGGAITAYQILSRPQPIAPRQSVEETRANAQSFDQKIEVIETARRVRSTQDRGKGGASDGRALYRQRPR